MLPTILGTLGTAALFYLSLFRNSSISLHRVPNHARISDRAHYKRLVYVVLDGLRFDGFIPVAKEGRYFNNMSVMRDPAIHKRVFLSVAGIPTETTSRIVGLVTGAPTSYLDVLFAHARYHVGCDTLLDQLAPRGISFYGDELWTYTFRALRTAPRDRTFCGFSKDNLAAKEDEVFEKLLQDVAARRTPAVFAHFISLDSQGHTYNTLEHPEIQRTMRRLDGYLRRIHAAMDEETLLVVVSDHGVTDEGSHGVCSTQELAASCAFITKQPMPAPDPELAGLDNPFARRFYDVDACGTAADWVRPRAAYEVAHQDDIVVTVAYLLGVPPPLNAYGTVIRSMLRERAALRGLIAFKEARRPADAAARKPLAAMSLAELHAHDARLTERIFDGYKAKSPLYALPAAALALWTLSRVRAGPWKLLGCAHVLAALVMVSHSYYSFASEDYFWFGAFLLENPAPENFLGCLAYLVTPERVFFAGDRLFSRHFRRLFRAGHAHTALFLGVLGLFVAAKAALAARRPGGRPADALRRVSCCAPQIAYSLVRLFVPLDEKLAANVLVAAYPTAASLLATHASAHTALLLLVVLPGLQARRTTSSKFALLSLLPYFSNLEKTIQSIDFNVFFTFTPRYEAASLAVSGLVYFALARVLVTLGFGGRGGRKRTAVDRCYVFLACFSLFFAFAASWVMYYNLVFVSFFLSRMIFTTGYAVFDLLFHLAQVYGCRLRLGASWRALHL